MSIISLLDPVLLCPKVRTIIVIRFFFILRYNKILKSKDNLVSAVKVFLRNPKKFNLSGDLSHIPNRILYQVRVRSHIACAISHPKVAL